MKKILGVIGALVITILVLVVVVWKRFERIFLKVQLGLLRKALVDELGADSANLVMEGLQKHFDEISFERPKTEKGVMRFHRMTMIENLEVP